MPAAVGRASSVLVARSCAATGGGFRTRSSPACSCSCSTTPGCPSRQPSTGHGEGWRDRLDLAYPGQLVAIELDGKESHLSDEAFEADPARDNRLCLTGWDVLHYTWHRFVDAPSALVREVRAELDGPSANRR